MIDKPLIIFDGVCNLCNRFVDFVIKNDSQDIFVFTSNQSEHGQKVLKKFNIDNNQAVSVYLLIDGKLFDKSTAVLKVLKKLSWYLNILYVLIILPKFIRDFLYNLIANNRYRLFGKRDSCRLPNEIEKSRFV